jgi:hypothetical protein
MTSISEFSCGSHNRGDSCTIEYSRAQRDIARVA